MILAGNGLDSSVGWVVISQGLNFLYMKSCHVEDNEVQILADGQWWHCSLLWVESGSINRPHHQWRTHWSVVILSSLPAWGNSVSSYYPLNIGPWPSQVLKTEVNVNFPGNFFHHNKSSAKVVLTTNVWGFFSDRNGLFCLKAIFPYCMPTHIAVDVPDVFFFQSVITELSLASCCCRCLCFFIWCAGEGYDEGDRGVGERGRGILLLVLSFMLLFIVSCKQLVFINPVIISFLCALIIF